MRIWNIPVSTLDRARLNGEHRELHVMWNVITKGKKGWSHHPETKRWVNRLPCLRERHSFQVIEMAIRKCPDDTAKRAVMIVDHKSTLESAAGFEDWPPDIYKHGWKGDVIDLMIKWILEDFKYGVGRISFTYALGWQLLEEPEFHRLALEKGVDGILREYEYGASKLHPESCVETLQMYSRNTNLRKLVKREDPSHVLL